MKTVRLSSLVTVILVILHGQPAEAIHMTFAPGDVFVSFEKGPVQWRNPDGTLNAALVSVVQGSTSEGMRFDAAGNLYVTHWCTDPTCTLGNTVEKFNITGMSQGTVGSGYSCNPHALAFDAAGNLYVGQADCTGNILKFSLGQPPTAYAVAAENRGSFWIDLASDGCTIFYTSWGPDVKRFDVCANTQLADFNLSPMPGGATQGLRLLPDGGVLVSSGAVVARLDATGALVQTYDVSTGEAQYWVGLDLVGDGTFWAVNYYSSNVYKFDLTTGAVLASFNTGTPTATAVDVRVSR
jgi:outer membrane protein assembly factor BamB